ncbi:hypothetical protein RUND412_002634 [Rhizina undulata]
MQAFNQSNLNLDAGGVVRRTDMQPAWKDYEFRYEQSYWCTVGCLRSSLTVFGAEYLRTGRFSDFCFKLLRQLHEEHAVEDELCIVRTAFYLLEETGKLLEQMVRHYDEEIVDVISATLKIVFQSRMRNNENLAPSYARMFEAEYTCWKEWTIQRQAGMGNALAMRIHCTTTAFKNLNKANNNKRKFLSTDPDKLVRQFCVIGPLPPNADVFKIAGAIRGGNIESLELCWDDKPRAVTCKAMFQTEDGLENFLSYTNMNGGTKVCGVWCGVKTHPVDDGSVWKRRRKTVHMSRTRVLKVEFYDWADVRQLRDDLARDPKFSGEDDVIIGEENNLTVTIFCASVKAAMSHVMHLIDHCAGRYHQDQIMYGPDPCNGSIAELPVNSPEIPVNSPEIPVNSPEIPLNSPELPLNSPEIPFNSPELPNLPGTDSTFPDF